MSALLANLAFGQVDSLSLSSGTTAPNGTVSLSLSLVSPAGFEPTDIQWTFTYPASNVASISATAGPAAANGSKSVNCAAGSGTYTCLATGMNATAIANGIVAVVNLTIANGANSTPIGVTNSVASSASGNAIAVTATGGVVTGSGGSAAPQLSSLSCSPTTLNTAGNTTCTVTLNLAAPSVGTAVGLTSNNNLLPVPASSVTVPANATSTTFTATAGNIGSDQSATLTASLNGASQTAAITLVAPVTISSLACNPTTLNSGAATTCTVTLTKAVPNGGTTVGLASNNLLLPVPASTVTVPANATSTTFTAAAGNIGSNQSATLTASLNGASQTAAITLVAPVTISSLACNPTTLNSGAATTCTVTLTKAAPNGGAQVGLTSNSTLLPMPTSAVTVPATATSMTFTATAGSIGSNQSATLTASMNGASQTATITLTASASMTISSLACNPTSLKSGATTTCTVTLSQAAPSGGVQVGLASNNNLLPMPAASVIVPANATSATFAATASQIPQAQVTILTATLNGASKQFSINVLGGTAPLSLSCNPTYLGPGGTTACTVKLGAAAPTGGTGIEVALTSNNALLPVPASVTVAAGSSSAVFKATASQVARFQTARITASVAGQSASIVILGRRWRRSTMSTSLSCLPRVVSAGAKISCTLEGATSSTGIPIRLAANTDQVDVPSLIAVRPNQSSLTFSAWVEPAARQQSVTLTANVDDTEVQDTVLVLSGKTPVLKAPGKQFVRLGEPLSFSVNAVDPADLPVDLTATGLPNGASFDPATGRVTWVPGPSQAGEYPISFTATDSAGQVSTAQVIIDADRGVPVLTPSQQVACSPNSLATLAGKWLSANESALSEPSGRSLELVGTQVQINGAAVPVLFSSSTSVTFLCPALEAGAPLSISVETPAGRSGSLDTTMQEFSPRILSVGGLAQNQGRISFPGTMELAMERNFQLPAHPAQPGDGVLIWTTGLTSASVAALSVTIGGAPAEIQSLQTVSGYAGLLTVHVTLPMAASIGDAVPVQLQVSGTDGRQVSSNTVTVAIEPIRQ